MKENYTISLTCVFCDTPLKKVEGKEFHSGDLIKCKNCDEYNDYDSVFVIAKEKGIELVKKNIVSELNISLKNFGK